MIRTIGIDPGSRYTGYGIVEGDGNRLRHVASGTVRLSGRLAFPQRLGKIYEELARAIRENRPDSMAVENVFFAKNVKSALKLGHARGAAILAGVNASLPVCEYSALEIKQSVVGYGRADKEQVEQMIRYLFGLRDALDTNAADALAVAVCHLNTSASQRRWSASKKS
jgi:crossover junction endodeoxyribonuclease RuvC